jgi:hypothetical protein
MKNFILKVVNGEPAEWLRIALLLTQGFFTGIFLATYDVATTTLFLEVFKANKEEMLAWSMAGAGTLGILSAMAIGHFQRRISYKKLAVNTLAIVAGAVALLALGLCFVAPEDPMLVFLANTVIGPSNAVVILLFWGMFGRIFSFRTAKRLAGGIDTGQAIATIFGLFAIPFVEPIIGNISNFLLISTAASLGLLAAARQIALRFSFTESNQASRPHGALALQGESSLLRNRYAGTISLFVICSALAASFVDYTFLATASERFTDQSSLAQFLSFFGATVIIASFLVQTFLNDLIIEMFGLKISLLLLPLLLLLFTASALGVAYVFDYPATASEAGMLLFFVTVSLSKLFVDALRDSLESPTVKLFFFPLDVSIRFDIQTKVEGLVSQSAGLLAGFIIMVLERVQYFTLTDCQYFIFLIIGGWALSTLRMHRGYSEALSRTLHETRQQQQADQGEHDRVIPRLLQRSLQDSSGRDFEVAAVLAEKIDPLLLERYLPQFAAVPDSHKQALMLRYIGQRRTFEALDELERFAESFSMRANSGLAKSVLADLRQWRKTAMHPKQVEQLALSGRAKDRIEACRLLPVNYREEAQPLLIRLLRDFDADVKRAAFLAVGKVRDAEFLPVLIDHLSVVGFENTAVSAILNFGEEAMPSLEAAFYKNGQKQNAMINIVQIYGLLGGARAISLLLRKTSFPDKRIVKETLHSLNYCGYVASGAMTSFIKNHLEQAVGNTLWLVLAMQEVKAHDSNRYLRRALQELVEQAYEEIFLLLSVIYDKKSVRLIENNLKGGTPDSIGYAIELLNIVAEDALLPMLQPILDDSPPEEKLRKLEGQFPRDTFSSLEALRHLMNRDYNSVDRWTRSCAIHSYALHPKAEVSNELIANIFNPDELVQETTAWALCTLDGEAYRKVAQRLPADRAEALDETVIPAVLANNEGLLLSMEKVIFLYRLPLLDGVPGVVLSDLIEWMEEVALAPGQRQPLRNEVGHAYMVLMASGQAQLLDEAGNGLDDLLPLQVANNDFLPTGATPAAALEAASECTFYLLLAERFYEIMGDHYVLASQIIDNLQATPVAGATSPITA